MVASRHTLRFSLSLSPADSPSLPLNILPPPGRLIELIRQKGGLGMTRVTYVVLDEADRMFSLGFEPQVRSILAQVRPDRQTLLFSATFKPALEKLARDVLTEPVRLTIGAIGDANEDVTQVLGQPSAGALCCPAAMLLPCCC